MDLLLSFALPLVLLLYKFLRRLETKVPTVSILEYLPNGVLHPVVQDPQNLTRVVKELFKRYGCIFYAWFGRRKTLFTAVPNDVLQVLSSDKFQRPDMVHHVFSTIAPGGIFSMPNEMHRAARKTLHSHFNSDMLRSFEEPMNKAIMALCEELKLAARDIQQDGSSKVVDISAMLIMTSFRVITNVAFGTQMDEKRREEFAKTLSAYMEEMVAEVLGYPLRQYMTLFGVRSRFFSCKRKVDDMCKAIVQTRQAESKEERNAREPDMLDAFLSMASGNEKLLTSLVVEFAIAGSHTVAQMVAWCIYEISCNTRVTREVDLEIKRVLGGKSLEEAISFSELSQLSYIHHIWRETLRLHTVSAGLIKQCKSEVTLKGSGIRLCEGANVIALYSALHVDAEVWTEPHLFKPERWGCAKIQGDDFRPPAGSFLPFSSGRRSCPGKFLADCEGPLILAELYRRLRFSLACKPEEIISCTAFVDTAKYLCKSKDEGDIGVPVHVQLIGDTLFQASFEVLG